MNAVRRNVDYLGLAGSGTNVSGICRCDECWRSSALEAADDLGHAQSKPACPRPDDQLCPRNHTERPVLPSYSIAEEAHPR